MKLWHLTPVENLPKKNPWSTKYSDFMFAVVVRAESETEARKIARLSGKEEDADHQVNRTLPVSIENAKSPWLDPKLTDCKMLCSDGAEGVILADIYFQT